MSDDFKPSANSLTQGKERDTQINDITRLAMVLAAENGVKTTHITETRGGANTSTRDTFQWENGSLNIIYVKNLAETKCETNMHKDKTNTHKDVRVRFRSADGAEPVEVFHFFEKRDEISGKVESSAVFFTLGEWVEQLRNIADPNTLDQPAARHQGSPERVKSPEERDRTLLQFRQFPRVS